MFLGIVEGLNQLLLPRFDVDAVLDLFLKERPVMFSGVPTMYMALNASGANLRKHRLHEVRTYTAGGAALPVNLKRSFEDKTGRPLFEG
jgi:long-chain acyl-CoA synthetase